MRLYGNHSLFHSLVIVASLTLVLVMAIPSSAHALDLAAVAAQNPPLWKDQRERTRQQWVRLSWDAYAARENRNPKYDDLVETATKRAAEILTGSPLNPNIDRPLLKRLRNPARKDKEFPAVGHFAHYIIARSYQPLSNRDFSRWLVPKGMDAFMVDYFRGIEDDSHESYSYLMQSILRVFQIKSFDHPKNDKQKEYLSSAATTFFILTINAITAHETLDAPEIILDVIGEINIIDDVNSVIGLHEAFTEHVFIIEEIPLWLRKSIDAKFHKRLAWLYRGGNWASKVEDEAWEKFHEHMNQAHQLVEEAWQDNPNEPRIAKLGAQIAPHIQSEVSMEEWVLRSQRVAFGYPDTLATITHFNRPRWGGSWEKLYAIGRGALDTGRFDLEITDGFTLALMTAVDEGVMLDRMESLRPFLQRAEVQASIEEWYTGASNPKLGSSPQRLADMTQIRAFLHYHCDHHEQAHALLATVDKGLLNDELAKMWRVNTKELFPSEQAKDDAKKPSDKSSDSKDSTEADTPKGVDNF